MAGTTGAAAYQRLEKPDNAISQGLQHWGGLEAQAQEGDRAAKAAAQAAGLKAKTEFDKTLALDPKDFETVASGFQSDDDIKRDYAINSRDEYAKLAVGAKEAYANGKYKEADALAIKMNMLKGNVKMVNTAQTALKTKFEDIVKAQGEGKVSGVDSDFIKMMQPFDRNQVRIVNDANGHPTLQYLEEDADGNKKVVSKSYSEMVDPSQPYIAKQDIYGDKGVVNNLASKLGKLTKTNERGINTSTTQVWDDKLQGKAVNIELDAYLSDDTVLADVLNQMGLNDNKSKDFTPAEREQARKALYDSVRSRYDEETKTGINTALMGLNQRNREFEYQKTQDAKAKAFNPISVVSTIHEGNSTPKNTLKTLAFGQPVELKTKGRTPTTIFGAKFDYDGNLVLMGETYTGNLNKDGVTSPQYKPIEISEVTSPEEVSSILTGMVIDDKGTRFEDLNDAKAYLNSLKGGTGNDRNAQPTQSTTTVKSKSGGKSFQYKGLDANGNAIWE